MNFLLVIPSLTGNPVLMKMISDRGRQTADRCEECKDVKSTVGRWIPDQVGDDKGEMVGDDSNLLRKLQSM